MNEMPELDPDAVKAIGELEAENKSLRKALRAIAWHVDATSPQAMIMKDFARKALRRNGYA